jgi:hypothetical protein
MLSVGSERPANIEVCSAYRIDQNRRARCVCSEILFWNRLARGGTELKPDRGVCLDRSYVELSGVLRMGEIAIPSMYPAPPSAVRLVTRLSGCS